MPAVECALYSENGYHQLWSWYLANLRNGNFKELLNNTVMYRLLKRFISEQLERGVLRHNNTLLLVSLSGETQQDSGIIDSFSRRYGCRLGNSTLHVTNLDAEGTSCCAERHYLVWQQCSRLSSASTPIVRSTSRIPSDYVDNEYLAKRDCEEVSCQREAGLGWGSPSYQEVPQHHSSLADRVSISSGSLSYKEPPQYPISLYDEVSHYARDPGGIFEDTNDDEDDGISLVFDFPPTIHRYTSMQVPSASSSEKEHYNSNGSDILPSTVAADLLSVRFKDNSIRSTGSFGSFQGERLERILTREVDTGSTSVQPLYYKYDGTPFRQKPKISEVSLSSGSEYSILPSIAISDRHDVFRFVLQSVLIINMQTDQFFTAVRQSEDDVTIPEATDDWLLYDNEFSIDDREVLSLVDILDMTRCFPKILFYSVANSSGARHAVAFNPHNSFVHTSNVAQGQVTSRTYNKVHVSISCGTTPRYVDGNVDSHGNCHNQDGMPQNGKVPKDDRALTPKRKSFRKSILKAATKRVRIKQKGNNCIIM